MTTTATPTPTPTSTPCPSWCEHHPIGYERVLHQHLVRELGTVTVLIEQGADDERPDVYLSPIRGGRFDEGLLGLTDAAQLAEALRDAVSIATVGVEHDRWMRMRAAVEHA